jgi:hypothetical protein
MHTYRKGCKAHPCGCAAQFVQHGTMQVTVVVPLLLVLFRLPSKPIIHISATQSTASVTASARGMCAGCAVLLPPPLPPTTCSCFYCCVHCRAAALLCPASSPETQQCPDRGHIRGSKEAAGAEVLQCCPALVNAVVWAQQLQLLLKLACRIDEMQRTHYQRPS